MSEQNKNHTSDNMHSVKNPHRKVNRKPKATTAVLIAVLISLFVVVMAIAVIGGAAFLYEKENPNHHNVDEYVDYSTDENGNKYFTSIDEDGSKILHSVDDIIKNQFNFLVIGKDRAAFNTDVMIIVSYNVDDGSVSMMQIPRDSYVQVADKYGNIKGGKANALLARYYNQARTTGVSYNEALTIACDNLRDAFSKIFGIPINHYVMLDLEGFVNIVDAIGGVDMTVPSDMYYSDPEQGLYINLKKGYQNLNGDEAEQFIRFRKGYVNADLGRIDAQKLFISAFIEKVQKSFSVDTIVNIVNQLSKYVTTDVELKDMVYFAKKALSVDPNNITMFTMPGDVSGKYYVAYRDETFEAVNTYLNPYKATLKSDKFAPDGSLYDAKGTSIYGVYTKTYSGNNQTPTYSAGNSEDIYIPKVSTTAATTKDIVETTSSFDAEDVHTTGPDEITDTETAEPDDEPTETTGEVETDEPAVTNEAEITVAVTTAEIIVTTFEPAVTAEE